MLCRPAPTPVQLHPQQVPFCHNSRLLGRALRVITAAQDRPNSCRDGLKTRASTARTSSANLLVKVRGLGGQCRKLCPNVGLCSAKRDHRCMQLRNAGHAASLCVLRLDRFFGDLRGVHEPGSHCNGICCLLVEGLKLLPTCRSPRCSCLLKSDHG